ncbi:catalytic, putative [Ricinus communis]|uniref:Catalytic, putative n=1 Tax=Ricinus communis TaxID=3988 RepID=B9SFW5_RICCO|nr:catalytic, putative [Ricinus communis]|eukprot:XP_025014152.1 uncharacterized protein LOC8286390 isoform X2 [Ricinus communis]
MVALRLNLGVPTTSTFYHLKNSKSPPPFPARLRAANKKKPEICTADELHYVPVSTSDWKLALWRYLPSPTRKRNHPLLLLSGVGTNAIGYDLSPESSFARFMSGQGFDTWILELRGAGLSVLNMEYGEDTEAVSKTDRLKSKLLGTFIRLFGTLSGPFFEDNYSGENFTVAKQIKEFRQKFLNIIEEGQHSSKSQFFDFQDRFSNTLEDFLKQVDLILKYDWDFDHYLEEDLPAAMEYIRTQCCPKDGKLLAVGHSMGGILLYAMLSKFCFEGRDPGLTSVTTLASSLDYTPSKSSLKLLLPVANPAKTFNVPIIPIGALLAAAHPFASRPPYILSWLNPQISAPGMMHPKLFDKLVMNNFCSVPAKLLLQLTTAFEEGGLRNRNGSFFYKDHLGKSNVPVLAIAGDQDLICPPEAVYETVKVIPEHLVTYQVFGEPRGPHYAHYDLVGGHLAAHQVYPCIINFLNRHDA